MLEKLTKRELEVLNLIVKGYSNVQIAESLDVTVHTAKAHVQSILYKLNLKNRVQVAVAVTKMIA